MKQLNLLALALAIAVVPVAVVAQDAKPTAGAKAMMQLDANRDGFIDRAEAARMPRLAERFDQLDKNRDGRLSADELPMRGHGMRHKGGGHAGWFQRADTNKDGRVSRAEALALNADAGERFDRMDFNKDGYVDRADMQARMAQKRDAFFAAADDNRDGRLSRDEFVVEMVARSAERRAQWAQKAGAKGKQAPARPAPTVEQQIQRATAMFDRMDTDKNGFLTRAEFDAAKGGRHGKADRAR